MSKFDRADTEGPLSDAPTDKSVAENVLLLTPHVGDKVDNVCTDHIFDQRDSEPAIVLVTLIESPRRRLQTLREHNNRLPNDISVICTAESLGRSSAEINGVEVVTISDPSDLARLGVKISDVLSALTDRPIVLCFYSLTDLIQLVELSRVFQFVYTLGGRVSASGAEAHYHLNPNAHDNQVISTLRPLFDSVIEVANGTPPSAGSNANHHPTDGGDSDYDPWDRLLDDER